jgi:CopG family nickel-responsive transcriptional regulator
MNRVTIVLDDELLGEVDRMVEKRGYQNRSEAIRDLARSGLRQMAETSDTGECIAALVYAYDHGERDLPRRLAKTFHDHHDLTVSALHVHLDHDSCLEVSVLKGSTKDVHHLADHVIAERGIRHGRLVMLPGEEKQDAHAHRTGSPRHRHFHVRRAG